MRTLSNIRERASEAPPPASSVPWQRTNPSANEETREVEDLTSGHSLFQEVFFFCTVKDIGELPGTGCIYVETVVDRDSGFAFAKVYPARTALNAVDILSTRVVPFFEKKGVAIREIHTRHTKEYCGLPLVHPYEMFLAAQRIRHLPLAQPGHPENLLCEQFYSFLLKEFFLPALRRKFHLTMPELRSELDTFVGTYNAAHAKVEHHAPLGESPQPNFAIDL